MSGRPPSLVTTARREAILCGIVFVSALTYTLVTCARMGYRDPGVPMEYVFGFPDWVFWGIIVPWGVCAVISALFSFVIMQDHDFEEAAAPTVGTAMTPDPSPEEMGSSSASAGGRTNE